MHRGLLLLLVGLGACRGHPGALEDVDVVAAQLEDVSLTTVAVIGGVVTGSGTLVVTEPSGAVRAYPVALRGGTLGALFEIDVDGPGQANRATLELPAPVVSANDLLGRYRGSTVSFSIGLGLDSVHLKNRRGVVLDKSYFTVGAGVHAGFEWIRIDVTDAVPQLIVSDTADTGQAAPIEQRRGCGCQPPPDPVVYTSDDDTGDTGTSAPGTEPGTSDSDPAEPIDPGAEPSDGDGAGACDGCGGGCGGGGCDEGCTSAPAPSLLWPVLALALWRRRRAA